MKTKSIFTSTTAIGLSLLITNSQANQSYQDIELENVKQQVMLIEKAERTGDPILKAKADKIKANLIMQEVKSNAENSISMEDKIIVIEQAKVSDDLGIKDVAETIKQDLILDDNSKQASKPEIKIVGLDNKRIGVSEVVFFALSWLSGAITILGVNLISKHI